MLSVGQIGVFSSFTPGIAAATPQIQQQRYLGHHQLPQRPPWCWLRHGGGVTSDVMADTMR